MNIGQMFNFALYHILCAHSTPPDMGSPLTYPNGEGVIFIYEYINFSVGHVIKIIEQFKYNPNMY